MPNKKLYIALGNFWKASRKRKNISQQELSKYLNYSSAQIISNVERGVCELPKHKVVRALKALDVPKEEYVNFYIKELSKQLDQKFK